MWSWIQGRSNKLVMHDEGELSARPTKCWNPSSNSHFGETVGTGSSLVV